MIACESGVPPILHTRLFFFLGNSNISAHGSEGGMPNRGLLPFAKRCANNRHLPLPAPCIFQLLRLGSGIRGQTGQLSSALSLSLFPIFCAVLCCVPMHYLYHMTFGYQRERQKVGISTFSCCRASQPNEPRQASPSITEMPRQSAFPRMQGGMSGRIWRYGRTHPCPRHFAFSLALCGPRKNSLFSCGHVKVGY